MDTDIIIVREHIIVLDDVLVTIYDLHTKYIILELVVEDVVASREYRRATSESQTDVWS